MKNLYQTFKLNVQKKIVFTLSQKNYKFQMSNNQNVLKIISHSIITNISALSEDFKSLK